MVLAAVTQLTSTPNILHNLSLTTSLLKRSAAAGARVVFFPEATDFISPNASVASTLTYSAESKVFLDEVKRCAKDCGVWVSVGVHEPRGEQGERAEDGPNTTTPTAAATTTTTTGLRRFWNTQVMINDTGSIVSKYRKTHLFDVDIQGGMTIKESQSTIAGEKIEDPLASPIGKLGVSQSVSQSGSELAMVAGSQ